MSKHQRVITAAILAALAIGILVSLASHLAAQQPAPAAAPAADSGDPYKLAANAPDTLEVSADAARRAGIVEAVVQTRNVPMTLTLTGRSGLNMETVTHVRAQFGGKVVNIGPQLGAFVKGPDAPGGPTALCAIESNDLAVAKANYIQAKIQARQDEDAYNRTKELVGAKVLAEKFLIDALSTLVKDRAALEAARQQLLIFGLKQREIDDVQNEVGRQRMDYVISSPRTGVISEKGVAGGEIADPTLNLFTVADTNTMWVWGDVYERDLRRIKVGDPMKIFFTSEPDRARECKIDWISPVIDPNTHSVRIRGLLENKDGHLLSDMYGTLIVTVNDGTDSLIVPADAVVREDEKAFIFVRTADADGKKQFRRTLVKIAPISVGFGASEGTSAAAMAAVRGMGPEPQTASLRILEGLKPGEVIVVTGALGLFNELQQQVKGG